MVVKITAQIRAVFESQVILYMLFLYASHGTLQVNVRHTMVSVLVELSANVLLVLS